MKIYISGPTRGDFKIPVENFKQAQDAITMMDIGKATIPHDLFDGVDVEEMAVGDDVRAELKEIMESSVLMLLPGWEKSQLCTYYKNTATYLGVTVKYYEKFMGAHAKQQTT